MRRIKTLPYSKYHRLILHPDLRLLLAVARAADRYHECHPSTTGQCRLCTALDRLNARPSGKEKDDE
jgi:hypothetical protein